MYVSKRAIETSSKSLSKSYDQSNKRKEKIILGIYRPSPESNRGLLCLAEQTHESTLHRCAGHCTTGSVSCSC
jgi:hypothetical protein